MGLPSSGPRPSSLGLFPPTSFRPRSSTAEGAGLRTKHGKSKVGSGLNGGLALLKDNFALSTWLLIGMSIQVFISLFMSRRWAFILPIALLCIRLGDTILQCFGLRPNPHMNNVIAGKFTSQFPNRTTAQWGEDEALDESDNTAANGVVVVLLHARTNHPLGVFAPGFAELGKWFSRCVQELEDESDNGFIGASSFNETERSSNNTLMTAFYFTDYEKLDRWTRASAHGSAIKWWDDGVKQGKYKHLTIAHELYRVPRGQFESVYVNSALTGLSSTSVKTDHGWVRPVVDASTGPLRTSRGRQAGVGAPPSSPSKADKASIYPRATAPHCFE